MNPNIEDLLKRVEFKKQFVEEYRKKCLERADVFSSYKDLALYCDAKIDAYNSMIKDINELFPLAATKIN
ncbi:hypothetical protein D1B33_17865 [Lysinibacillus yapensis]|uniref:Uncharacterized protein n=1 Tax=Ureibacillus yapensis TaxID=2304605 RepID=A0A396SAB0_9BACL|nr:hypothetical protein [Lysinibacillus yapensis]RHW31378.1 hypothetical protein D1B33_17865 [Lysinibacillus yapensis]